MSDKKFLSRHDIDVRLNGCLVKYKSEYYRACLPSANLDVTESTIHLMNVSTGEMSSILVDANSNTFQYQFYNSLGWLPNKALPELYNNYSSIYISRAPFRKYKAGISASCLNFIQFTSGGIHNLDTGVVESQRFQNMLDGNYTPLKIILEGIKIFQSWPNLFREEGVNDRTQYNIAVSRDWALCIRKNKDLMTKVGLLFGAYEIGTVNLETDTAIFNSNCNNSFYWEKFNEVFSNCIFIDTGAS